MAYLIAPNPSFKATHPGWCAALKEGFLVMPAVFFTPHLPDFHFGLIDGLHFFTTLLEASVVGRTYFLEDERGERLGWSMG